MKIIRNTQPVVGSVCDAEGVSFGIYVNDLPNIKLNIHESVNDDAIFSYVLERDKDSYGDFFYTKVEGLTEGYYYTWSVQFEGREHFLIDPYGIEVVREENGRYFNKIAKLVPNDTNRLHIPWEETIIYEVHVGHFTKDKTSGVDEAGTFNGMIEKFDYLKDMGVTTLELLPIYLWNRHTLVNRHPVTHELLKDVWGYNPISFFALDPVYMTDKENLRDNFKAFVRAAHDKGLEVVLDVVYNHTGEGGEGGPIFNFKALNRHAYYRHYHEWYTKRFYSFMKYLD